MLAARSWRKALARRLVVVHFLVVELFPAFLAIGAWVALALGVSEAVTLEHGYEGLQATQQCVRSRVAQMLLGPHAQLRDPRACPSVRSSARDDRLDDEVIAGWTIWVCRCAVYAPVLLLLSLIVFACSAFAACVGVTSVGSASYLLFCLQLRHRRTYRVLSLASARVAWSCLGICFLASVVPALVGEAAPPVSPWAVWRNQALTVLALLYACRALARPPAPLHPWLASAEFAQAAFRRTWAQVLTEPSDVLCLRFVDALWRAQHSKDAAALAKMLRSPGAEAVLSACAPSPAFTVEQKALDDASSFANLALPHLLSADDFDDATILNDLVLPQLLPPDTLELAETVAPDKTCQDKSQQQERTDFQTEPPEVTLRAVPPLLTPSAEVASAFRVIFSEGLVVRSGLELATPQVATLAFGETFEAWGRVVNEEGTGRLLTRLGWVSERGAPGSAIADVWLVAALDAEDLRSGADLPAFRPSNPSREGGPMGHPELRSVLSLLAAERARAARLELHLAEEQLARATAEARLRSVAGIAAHPPLAEREAEIEDVTRIKL